MDLNGDLLELEKGLNYFRSFTTVATYLVYKHSRTRASGVMSELVERLIRATRWREYKTVKELLNNPECDVNMAIDGRRLIADAIQQSGTKLLKLYLNCKRVDLKLWCASFAKLEDRNPKPTESFSRSVLVRLECSEML